MFHRPNVIDRIRPQHISAKLRPLDTPYRMVTGNIENHNFSMTKPDFKRAIKEGFFEIPMTVELRKHMNVIDDFSSEFYKDKKNDNSFLDKYRGFNHTFNAEHPELDVFGFDGYVTDNFKPTTEKSAKQRLFQLERFALPEVLGRTHWKYFPKEVQAALHAMKEVGEQVYKFTLDQLNFPEEFQVALSGGVTQGVGGYYAIFNRYDPCINAEALKSHADWGGITILRSKQPGLEAIINNRWQEIRPSSDNHLIVNFGAALEMLTAKLPDQYKIVASKHRVIQQSVSRQSLALFVDPHPNAPLFESREGVHGREYVLTEGSYEAYSDKLAHLTHDTGDTPKEWKAKAKL